VQYDEVRAAIAQRREAKRRVKRVLLSATPTEEPLSSTASASTSASTLSPTPAATSATAAATDRPQSMEPLKEKPRLISAAIDPKVFPDSDDDDDDDDDPITLPATVRTPGDEDLPFESSCSTLDSPLVTFAVHCSSPASSSPPNSPSALEASIGTDWRAGLASAENDDDDDEVVEKVVEKVQAESKSSKMSDWAVQSVISVNSTAEGETEIEEDDDDATQCAAEIDCSPKQAHFTATAKPTSNTNGLASIEVKCSAMTIQERMRSADAAAAARTAHGAAQSEPRTSSSSAAAATASRESRELWMGPLSPKPSPSPLVAASSPAPATVITSMPSLRPTGGGVTVKDQGANRDSDRDGDGEDLGEIVIRSTPEKPCKDDYSSGSQSSEKQRLNQSSSKTGGQNNTTHSSTSTSTNGSSSSSSSSNSSSSTGHNRHQHHTAKLISLNNINAIDSKTVRHSQGQQQKSRCLADALTTKKTTISKPTCDTFYGKKS
jgi:trimeric autotransporter adhesin